MGLLAPSTHHEIPEGIQRNFLAFGRMLGWTND
jgi:hypothetical protein